MPPRKLIPIALIVVAALAGLATVLFFDSGEEATSTKSQGGVPFAILGDSDSHSFHDRTYFPEDSGYRGGKHRDITFNWPEVLARLRGDFVDLGKWGVWGPPSLIGKMREIARLPVRRPRKEDFRHNFAITGASCKDLNQGWRQVDRLLSVVRLEPSRWDHGVVVIRIGVNDIGGVEQFEEFAADPESGAARVHYCTSQIELAVKRIRELAPQVRFVLVGIFNNAHWAPNLEKWQSPEQLSNISRALDRFDTALRGLAAKDANTVFFDDRRWFESLWGSRDASGRPAYRDVVMPSGMHVVNAKGDEPTNAALADGHAGTVWNGLWAKSLVDLLNEEFAMQIPPISETEVEQLLSR